MSAGLSRGAVVGLVLAACACGGWYAFRGMPSANAHVAAAHQGRDASVITSAPVVERSRVTKSNSLPYVAPHTSTAELAVFVDRNAPLDKRLVDDIASFLPNVSSSEDINAVISVLCDVEEHDGVRNEAANLLRRSRYDRLALVVSGVVIDGRNNDRFRGWAVQHLGTILLEDGVASEPEPGLSALQDGVSDRAPEVRREAILALCRLRDRFGIEAAVAEINGKGDGDPMVLISAIRGCAEAEVFASLPRIRGFAQHADERVRVATIAVLGDLGDMDSRQLLEGARNAGTPRVQRAAQQSLAQLDAVAGKQSKAPSVAPGDKAGEGF